MRGSKWRALGGAVNSFTRRDRSVLWYGYQSRDLELRYSGGVRQSNTHRVDHEISNHTNLDDLPLFGLSHITLPKYGISSIHYRLSLAPPDSLAGLAPPRGYVHVDVYGWLGRAAECKDIPFSRATMHFTDRLGYNDYLPVIDIQYTTSIYLSSTFHGVFVGLIGYPQLFADAI